MSVDDDIPIREDTAREDAAQVRRFVEARTPEERGRVFEAFVQRHQPWVHAHCIRQTGDVHAAADATQETFLAAWRGGLRQIKQPEAVRGWLRTTASRQAIRQSSGASAKKKKAAVIPVADVGDVPQLAAEQQARNEEQMNAAQLAGRVEAGILLAEKVAATLPAPHQRMYDLRMRRQLAGAELGAELGVSPDKAAKLADKFRIFLRNAVGATVLVRSGEGCDRLLAITAKAGPQGEVLEPGLRETAVRHISHCGTCEPRQAQLMMRYAPALVPLLYGAASPPAAEAGGTLAPAGAQAAQAPRQPAAFMATRFEQAKAACYVRLTSLVNFAQASGWGRVAAAGVATAVVLSPAAAAGMPSPAPAVQAAASVRGSHAPLTTTAPHVLHFALGSAALLPSADSVLQLIAQQANAQGEQVTITGYTSPEGTAAYNHALSLHRAEAVRDRLISLGLPAGQITRVTGAGTTGNPGSACLVHGKLDEALCTQLRRVVITLTPAKR